MYTPQSDLNVQEKSHSSPVYRITQSPDSMELLRNLFYPFQHYKPKTKGHDQTVQI